VSRLFRLSFGFVKDAAEVQRSVRFDVLLVVILVVGQGLCLPLTGQVVWAVTSWDDPDADDGESIRRLRMSEVHHASGLPSLMHMGPNRRIDPPGVRCSAQSRTSSRLIARAPPSASSHASSRYPHPTLSCRAQFDLNRDWSSPAHSLRERSLQQCPTRTGAR
jgi:hypothetical protein